MPAKSIAQQRAFGAALAAKRGDIPASKLKGPARSIYKSASTSDIKEFAGTSQKGLPRSVKALKNVRKRRK